MAERDPGRSAVGSSVVLQKGEVLDLVVTYSVVICAYTLDRWDDLTAAVESALSQQPAPVEVILVVDYNDGLLRRATAAFPRCVVVKNTQQRGLSGARNTGVSHATGDVVAFVDDDARCDPGWAAALLGAYTDASVVGVGGRVVPDWRAARPAWFPDEFLWVVGCSYRGQPTERAVVRNGIGANMSFRRDVLQQVGGFSSLVGRVGNDAAGCEETELSIRAVRAAEGARIVLIPDAVVRHAVTEQRVTRRYFRARCRAEGRSKAIILMLVGKQEALSAERSYVTRVLTTAVLRGLIPSRGRPGGLARSTAVVEGFVLTASSYARQRLRQASPAASARRAAQREPSSS